MTLFNDPRLPRESLNANRSSSRSAALLGVRVSPRVAKHVFGLFFVNGVSQSPFLFLTPPEAGETRASTRSFLLRPTPWPCRGLAAVPLTPTPVLAVSTKSPIMSTNVGDMSDLLAPPLLPSANTTCFRSVTDSPSWTINWRRRCI